MKALEPLRPLVTLLVAALLATALAVTVTAAPAGATDTAAPAATLVQDHARPVDACTVVPDAIPGVFQFTPACLVHDECYGTQSLSRLGCDLQFLDDMKASCDDVRWTLPQNRDRCLKIAGVYFYGVRLLGGFFWTDVT